MKKLACVLAFTGLCITAIAQAPIIRLSEEYASDYNTSQTLYFIKFSYSGNRSGVIEDPQSLVAPWNTNKGKYEGLGYDDMLTYSSAVQSSPPYDSVQQWFDNNDRLTYARRYSQNVYAYDTIVYNGSFIDSSISYTAATVPANAMRTVVRYNSLGQRYFTRAYKNSSLYYTDTFSYDASGNLVRELRTSHIAPDTVLKRYTYDNNNKLISAITFSDGLNYNLDTFEMYTYSYDAQGRNYRTWQSSQRDPQTGNIKPLYMAENRYKGAQLDRVYRLKWDEGFKQYDTWDEYNLQYNSFGYVSIVYESQANGTILTSRLFNYTHTWPVSVTGANNGCPEVHIYPNPAADVLNIKANFAKTQPLTACITDMQGRVLMQWKEAATKEYTRTIPTAALPAGTYVLKITGEGWEQAKMFSVR